MARKTYKKQIQKLTGMTDDQYKTAYANFAARTRNYNAIAGTSYEAAHAFYISVRYAGNLSAGIQDILNTPATRTRKPAQTYTAAMGAKTTTDITKAATDTLLGRWKPFIDKSADDHAHGFGSGDAAKIAERLKNGIITPEEADSMLRKLKENADTRRSTDPTYKY